jgi:hypothetical protein
MACGADILILIIVKIAKYKMRFDRIYIAAIGANTLRPIAASNKIAQCAL